jgi:hypothetical protein
MLRPCFSGPLCSSLFYLPTSFFQARAILRVALGLNGLCGYSKWRAGLYQKTNRAIVHASEVGLQKVN